MLPLFNRLLRVGYNTESESLPNAWCNFIGAIDKPGQFVKDLRTARRAMRAQLNTTK